MFHRVKEVNIMKDYILHIIFQDGSEKYYDVSKLFKKWDIFQNLKTVVGLFEQVKVDKGGYGISFHEIDLSCDELWENGYI